MTILNGLSRKRGAWTPAKLGGLGAYWWDAASGVTLRSSMGTDYVSDWADRLQGVSLAQSTTADQPTYDTIGGLPAICVPGGTTQTLHGLFGETLTEMTILAAYAKLQDTSSGNRGYVWDGQNVSARVPMFGRFAVQFASYFDDGGGNGDRTYTGTDATALKSAGGTLVNRVYGSSAAPILHVNGGAGVECSDVPTTGEMTLDGITIFNAFETGKASSAATLGHLRELIVVPSDVGVSVINQWLAYCNRKYSLSYTEAS